MAAMKRFINLFLCSILLCLLSACSLVEELPVFQTKPAHNTIAPKVLTKREKELIDLLSGTDEEIYLFSYKADQEYTQIDFWVEIYKDGVLIDPNAGGFGMIPQETDAEHTGTLAVSISHTPDYRWRFSLKGISSTSEPNTNYPPDAARGYQPLVKPIEIEDNKEIILYTSVFSTGSFAAYDNQTYAEQPELLQRYPYAHIIKCKFSKVAEEV